MKATSSIILPIFLLVFGGHFLSSKGFFIANMTESLDSLVRQKRIINGSPANEREFPYLALVYKISSDSNDMGQLCGGAIISSRWIISAGHCLPINFFQLYVGVGITNIKKSSLENFGKIVKVASFQTTKHDIGLGMLERPLQFNDRVQPIKLPRENYNVPPYTKAMIMGWGMDDETMKGGSFQLNKVEVVILPDQKCYDESYSRIDSRKILCSLNNNNGPCSGDSGGPLVTADQLLIGITSSGPEYCASSEITVHYVNVAYYRKWIKDNSGV